MLTLLALLEIKQRDRQAKKKRRKDGKKLKGSSLALKSGK